jgi:predicted nucleic acid-binding protein
MKTVVSNTSPIRYLISIGEPDLLPQLFGNVLIPKAVYQELTHENTPDRVRQLIQFSPTWLEIGEVKANTDKTSLSHLDAGESEAILLTEQIKADLLLIDEKKGRLVAKERGLTIIGVLGLLELANQQQLIDLRQAIDKLLKTNINISPSLIESILKTNTKK